ncbi:MAG: hypothetical protein ACT4O9_15100 [Blastocatellia bacterium]
MNDLDEVWSQMLSGAIEKAKSSGRNDIADYLELKANNDAVRKTGVDWLINNMIEIAAGALSSSSTITIDRTDPHIFTVKNSNLVGSMLKIRQGVRCLTLEAGWTRTPSDGFMRGGALALARITHFGMPKHGADLILQMVNDVPAWNLTLDGKVNGLFGSQQLQEHFAIFAGF